MSKAWAKGRLARLRRRSRDREEIDQLLACLQALGNPPYWALGAPTGDAEQLLEAARRETFRVGDRMTRLSVPVDWRQGVEHGPTWRLHLHSFSWLDALFREPGQDARLLELALALVLDWADTQRPGEDGDADLAWSGMATAVRAPIFAYVLRSSAYRGLLDGEKAAALRKSVVKHGRYLAENANYASDSDQGLYQDAGLVLLTDYLPFLPQSPKWRRHAKRRFISSLRERVQREEAIPLERSPQSQFRFHALVAGLMHQMEVNDESAKDLLARMGEAASWFVMPDGRLPQLLGSDSSWKPPSWAVEAAESVAGSMVAPRSGYAIIKEAGSYLIVSAAYRSERDERAYELTFSLFHDGTRVIEDPGPEEHSGLIVDGQGFGFEGKEANRSAITASGEGDQWDAILVENPLLLSQGVRHRRLFLFQPQLGLVVVDRVEADKPHRYTRFFHLGRDVSVDGDRLAGERFQGRMADFSETVQRRRVIRGAPESVQGARDREGQRASVVELTCDRSSDTFVAAVSLQPEALSVPAVKWRDDDSIRVRIATSEQPEEITVVIRDTELLVAEELVEDWSKVAASG